MHTHATYQITHTPMHINSAGRKLIVASLFLVAQKQGYSTAQGNLSPLRQGGASGLLDLRNAASGLGSTGLLEPSKAKVVKWYHARASQGNIRAQTWLAKCYEEGVVVPRDLKQAVAWYDKAAKQGDKTAVESIRRIRPQLWPPPSACASPRRIDNKRPQPYMPQACRQAPR